MNAETAKRNDWQLSLANVMVFVFAVAIWGLLVTQSAILERRYITFGVVAAAIVTAFLSYRARRRAVMLLVALFLLVVLGSHSMLRYRAMQEMEVRERRLATLYAVSNALTGYEAKEKGWPPMSKNLKQSGIILFNALMTPVKKGSKSYGPFLSGTNFRSENGERYLTGATGSLLLWAKTSDWSRILIDTGPDNLPGGTFSEDGIYTPGPVDANGDGKNDGADDLTEFVGPMKHN